MAVDILGHHYRIVVDHPQDHDEGQQRRHVNRHNQQRRAQHGGIEGNRPA